MIFVKNKADNLNPNLNSFKRVGFTFAKESETLNRVILPNGWELEPDAEGCWGNIIDDMGRIRGFYKSAIPGTIDHMTLISRYQIESAHTLPNTLFSPIRVYVTDNGVFSFNVGRCPHTDSAQYDNLIALAIEHLNGKYPGWKDPTKYWD